MGGKRNKIRYTSTPKARVPILLTGKVYLQYVDDEAAEGGKKGDLLVFPQNEALHTTRQGEYGSTGFSGYFKVDVSDGHEWCAVLPGELFPEEENHFSKTERPIDRYRLCEEMLVALKGRTLVRTYRDHYMLEELPEIED